MTHMERFRCRCKGDGDKKGQERTHRLLPRLPHQSSAPAARSGSLGSGVAPLVCSLCRYCSANGSGVGRSGTPGRATDHCSGTCCWHVSIQSTQQSRCVVARYGMTSRHATVPPSRLLARFTSHTWLPGTTRPNRHRQQRLPTPSPVHTHAHAILRASFLCGLYHTSPNTLHAHAHTWPSRCGWEWAGAPCGGLAPRLRSQGRLGRPPPPHACAPPFGSGAGLPGG